MKTLGTQTEEMNKKPKVVVKEESIKWYYNRRVNPGKQRYLLILIGKVNLLWRGSNIS